MAVMHVPDRQPASWPQPQERTAIEDLRDLRERVEAGKRRVELIEGRLIVSPTPVLWHEMACIWLDDQFRDACRAKGWMIDRAGEIDLPPTSDVIEPDLMILRDLDSMPRLESTRSLDHVVLVAEVISQSSIREDREVKPRSCGLAGVPLYLLVDRFSAPMTVSLFSEPCDGGYARLETVNVGEKLRISAPFDVTLDTGSLPSPAPRRPSS
jgi:Uma2 family endonuclease